MKGIVVMDGEEVISVNVEEEETSTVLFVVCVMFEDVQMSTL